MRHLARGPGPGHAARGLRVDACGGETRDSYHGYVYPDIAAQIETASQTEDPAERAAPLLQAQKDIWSTWPAMWAFAQNNALAHRNHVEGIELRATNSYDLGGVRLS